MSTTPKTDDLAVNAALAIARGRVALKNGPFGDRPGQDYNPDAVMERTAALNECLHALEALLKAAAPLPADEPVSHFTWDDTEALRAHLLGDHDLPEWRKGAVASVDHTHLTTIHQSEHDGDEAEGDEPKSYWLHTTFSAPSDEQALLIASTIVNLHPVLDTNAWDISEGGDWSEMVAR